MTRMPFCDAPLRVSVKLYALRHYKITQDPSRYRFGRNSPIPRATAFWALNWDAFINRAGKVAPCVGVTDNGFINLIISAITYSQELLLLTIFKETVIQKMFLFLKEV